MDKRRVLVLSLVVLSILFVVLLFLVLKSDSGNVQAEKSSSGGAEGLFERVKSAAQKMVSGTSSSPAQTETLVGGNVGNCADSKYAKAHPSQCNSCDNPLYAAAHPKACVVSEKCSDSKYAKANPEECAAGTDCSKLANKILHPIKCNMFKAEVVSNCTQAKYAKANPEECAKVAIGKDCKNPSGKEGVKKGGFGVCTSDGKTKYSATCTNGNWISDTSSCPMECTGLNNFIHPIQCSCNNAKYAKAHKPECGPEVRKDCSVKSYAKANPEECAKVAIGKDCKNPSGKEGVKKGGFGVCTSDGKTKYSATCTNGNWISDTSSCPMECTGLNNFIHPIQCSCNNAKYAKAHKPECGPVEDCTNAKYAKAHKPECGPEVRKDCSVKSYAKANPEECAKVGGDCSKKSYAAAHPDLCPGRELIVDCSKKSYAAAHPEECKSGNSKDCVANCEQKCGGYQLGIGQWTCYPDCIRNECCSNNKFSKANVDLCPASQCLSDPKYAKENKAKCCLTDKKYKKEHKAECKKPKKPKPGKCSNPKGKAGAVKQDYDYCEDGTTPVSAECDGYSWTPDYSGCCEVQNGYDECDESCPATYDEQACYGCPDECNIMCDNYDSNSKDCACPDVCNSICDDYDPDLCSPTTTPSTGSTSSTSTAWWPF